MNDLNFLFFINLCIINHKIIINKVFNYNYMLILYFYNYNYILFLVKNWENTIIIQGNNKYTKFFLD